MIHLSTIASVIDLTLLDKEASNEKINALLEQANHHAVAAICLFPSQFINLSIPTPTKRATVVNFPFANESLSDTLATLDWIVSQQLADEIDYVFPYQLYLNGKQAQALSACKEVIQYCKHQHLSSKIIVETECFLDQKMLFQLCLQVIALEADFLKTSTGFKPIGATLAAAEILLRAIKETHSHTGIKISGGVRTLTQAESYIHLAEELLGKPIHADWFRVGSSSLLAALIAASTSSLKEAT